jgi:uncharacterized coiled-coil DUF342 family protein
VIAIDTFEVERVEWQEEAEQLRLAMERVHSSEIEMLAKKTEIAEVQKIMSDQRLAVHDERQQFMKLRREYNQILSKYWFYEKAYRSRKGGPEED